MKCGMTWAQELTQDNPSPEIKLEEQLTNHIVAPVPWKPTTAAGNMGPEAFIRWL